MTAAQLIMAVWLGLGAPAGGGATPTPEAEAEAYQKEALVFYDAGDFASAADLFERAYQALPDPVLHRKSRGRVLASLRGTLLDLHDNTEELAPLARLRDLLVRHRDALVGALGEAARPEDTAGVQAQINEVEQQLESLAPPPLLTRTAAKPTPASAPSPSKVAESTTAPGLVAPLHSPEDAAVAAARGRRRVGAALLGSSAVPLVAAAVALGVHLDRYRRIADLDHTLDAAERPATTTELAQVDEFGHQSVVARSTAIATATIGGVLLVAGVTVLATSRRPPPPVSVAPLLTPRAWGLGLTGRF